MAKRKARKTKRNTEPDHVDNAIYAVSGKCLGVRCYRGFAKLSSLSQMSMADVYHQTDNPNGTQRNLNTKHAKEAYEYASKGSGEGVALWPEIILNVRDKSAIKVTRLSGAKGPKDKELWFVKVMLHWDVIDEAKKRAEILIARVDGNHRLHYAGGEIRPKSHPPLDDVYSPFCLMVDVPPSHERVVFRTINEKQAKLNVDHLLRIEQQMTPMSELWQKNKELWIVTRLGEESASPFYGKVHKGGKKSRGEAYLINQKGLLDGVTQLLKSFVRHKQITPDKLLKIVMNYFTAVETVWPNEWRDKKRFKLMTNTGLQALGILGGRLAEEMVPAQSLQKRDFEKRLRKLKTELPDFWVAGSEHMANRGGRAGAVLIAEYLMEQVSSLIDDGMLQV